MKIIFDPIIMKASIMSMFSIFRKLDLYPCHEIKFWTSFSRRLSIQPCWGDLLYAFPLVWRTHIRHTHDNFILKNINEL